MDNGVWIEAAAGPSTGAYVLSKVLGMTTTRVVSIDVDATARRVGSHINQKQGSFPGLDHTIKSLDHVTEEFIISLGKISLFTSGTPCGDFSLLKLASLRNATDNNRRDGLNGTTGRLFKVAIQVWRWILKNNPDAVGIFEMVNFSDMRHQWSEVCELLGVKPYIIDAADHSFTRRERAFWVVGMEMPADWPPPPSPMSAQKCMNRGRIIECTKKAAISRSSVPGTITKNWHEREDGTIVQDTHFPIRVQDSKVGSTFLTVKEAELLHGMPAGLTAAPGVSEVQRLKVIGNGWDHNVIKMILQQYRRHRETAVMSPIVRQVSQELQQHQRKKLRVLATAMLLQPTSLVLQAAEQSEDEVQKAFRNAVRLLKHHNRDTLKRNSAGAILDSGSSKHLHGEVVVTNSQLRFNMSGFQGSQKMTSGNGHWLLNVTDAITGSAAEIRLDDADKMLGISNSLISMGKLLRLSWKFDFDGVTGAYWAYPPDTSVKIRVELGHDDILRLPSPPVYVNSASAVSQACAAVTAEQDDELATAQLQHHHEQQCAAHAAVHFASFEPLQQCSSVNMTRQVRTATGNYVHRLCNHGGTDKMSYTLKFTKGYKEMWFSFVKNCRACALGDSRRRGIKHTRLPHPSEKQAAADSTALQCTRESQVTPLGVFLEQADDYDDVDSDIDSGELDDLAYAQYQIDAEKPGKHDDSPCDWSRFDLATLQPFEAVFADFKEYDCYVRGGAIGFLMVTDYKSRVTCKFDVKQKTEVGIAFQQYAVRWGVHKLGYLCTVHTDGCGSMKHVRQMANRMGIDHRYVPSKRQSLNPAEKAIDVHMSSTRVVLIDTVGEAGHVLFSKCLEHVLHHSLRIATDAPRGWLTPLEIAGYGRPRIDRLRPFFTQVIKWQPKRHKSLLDPVLHHGSIARLIGYRDCKTDSEYKIWLQHDNGSHSIAHSRDVVFDVHNFRTDEVKKAISAEQPGVEPSAESDLSSTESESEGTVETSEVEAFPEKGRDFPSSSSDSEDVVDKDDAGRGGVSADNGTDQPRSIDNSNSNSLPPPKNRKQKGHFRDLQSSSGFRGPAGTYTESRYKRSSRRKHANSALQEQRIEFQANMTKILSKTRRSNKRTARMLCDTLDDYRCKHPTDLSVCTAVAEHLANLVQKDVKWKEAIEGPDRIKVEEAFNKERTSLMNKILRPLNPEDGAEFELAVKEATKGRWLLDLKRSGDWKARGVKQGFLEYLKNPEADGPGFITYAHVAKLTSARLLLFRRGRKDLKHHVMIKDISTAFLQSDKFPEGKLKYIYFKNPFTNQLEYFAQNGPIYGEASAPRRWEDTFAPWLEKQGFVRAKNERGVFYHPKRQLAMLLYVDDCCASGRSSDLAWLDQLIDKHWEAKPAEYLTENNPLDYLGIDVSMDKENVYMSMEKYVKQMLYSLNFTAKKHPTRPMIKAVDTSSPIITDPERRKWYMKGVGCIGWLNQTVRLDLAHTYSRLAQHLSEPTESAMSALEHALSYVAGTPDMALSAALEAADEDLTTLMKHGVVSTSQYSAFSDSDYAQNSEPQNKRRSQNGACLMQNKTPVWWSSKAHSKCTAHDWIKHAHADMSTAAAEVYAAGNATKDLLHISYIVEEMGMSWQRPIMLGVDNAAAIAFADDSCEKTELKHIDVRQEWVKVLRDHNLVITVHVDTASNLADFFTKILDEETFLRHRNTMMTALYVKQNKARMSQ